MVPLWVTDCAEPLADDILVLMRAKGGCCENILSFPFILGALE